MLKIKTPKLSIKLLLIIFCAISLILSVIKAPIETTTSAQSSASANYSYATSKKNIDIMSTKSIDIINREKDEKIYEPEKDNKKIISKKKKSSEKPNSQDTIKKSTRKKPFYTGKDANLLAYIIYWEKWKIKRIK